MLDRFLFLNLSNLVNLSNWLSLHDKDSVSFSFIEKMRIVYFRGVSFNRSPFSQKKFYQICNRVLNTPLYLKFVK